MKYQQDFKANIPSAFYLEYREADRVMKVDMDFRDETPVVSHRAVRKWEPPFADESISKPKKSEIMANIIFYLSEIRKFKFEVDGGSLAESREYKN
jgi:hypothetical protein